MNTAWFLAIGILTSSFFGSWHCAAMCGPIATLMGHRKSLLPYHFGRMVSYLSLGLLAGSLGQFFLNSEFVLLRWISAFLFGLILISMGLRWFSPKFFKGLPSFLESHGIVTIIRRVQKFHLSQSGFVVGLLTALLPCGWLYTYVTAAIATQSPWSGIFVMFLFWLGGLPALSIVPSMIRQTLQAAPLKHQRIGGLILVAAGLYSIFSFLALHQF